MTRLRLLLRNLLYFRAVNLAVVVGTATATAVISGALMVGDSVRGSLAALALQRLGQVDDALISTRFFEQTLADRLNQNPGDAFEVMPAAIVRGAAANDATGNKTADVQIASIERPPTLPSTRAWLNVPRGKCVINGELADALDVKAAGESILLSVPSDSDTPRDAALSRRARGDTVSGMRLEVAEIVRQPGMATLFNPNGGQRVPRNAWVNLADLQEAIDQPARVNALLAHEKRPGAGASGLNEAMSRVINLADYGLIQKAVLNGSVIALGSRQTYLAPPVVDAAERAAHAMNVPLQKVAVNLLNTVRGKPGRVIYYAVAAGITPLEGRTLGADEVAVNQWTADALDVKAGDRVAIDFYQRASSGALQNASASLPASALTFRVASVLPMNGVGADPSLPPEYKGLTDADSVADWDPPEGLQIDQSLVTKADEAYWRRYRAAPKIFISFETATRLWGGIYGDVTGLRVPSSQAEAFSRSLRDELQPAAMGMAFRPLKAEQLAAANGGTDFSEYFLYFSFFLIGAAVLLVAMLFRLGVEQRSRQLGLMGAMGFSPGAIRRMALSEGSILALIGGAVGVLGGVGYTWLVMAGLRTWWVGAVGTRALQLHVNAPTLATGFVAGVVVAIGAVLWGAWRVGGLTPARLLAGGWEGDVRRGRRNGAVQRWIGMLGACAGLAMLGAAVFKWMPVDVAFLCGGGLLLCSALFWLAALLRPRRREGATFIGTGSVYRLGFGNASRHTARSVLAIGLIAFAVFTLIVVAVMRQGTSAPTQDRSSGTGGFQLMLQADIPIFADLNTAAGRHLAGIHDPGDSRWNAVHFTQMRRWAGQDISCLNLTRPRSPTILSVPPEMVERNAFTAASNQPAASRFWTLLEGDAGDAIPVIADDQTAQYVLQLSPGQELQITDQLGRPRKLRLVATLANSIFQSELLMGDANFRKLFPAQGGYGTMLIDCPPPDAGALGVRLSSELDEYSVSVETTAQRLATYEAVANTYLSTFQTLGSLGLLLGTIGLGVVLVRTVVERRGELALLSCLGFNAADRVRLILAENAFLLLLGLMVGTIAALVGVLPAIVTSGRQMNLTSLIATLAAVVVVGLLASTIAVRVAGANASAADLRRE